MNNDTIFLSPLQSIPYIESLQYMGAIRSQSIPWFWKLEEPSITIPRVTSTATVEAANLGKDIGFTKTFTYACLDSSVIATRFGRLYGLPDADTIGRIMNFGGTSRTADSILFNHFIKSIPLVTDTASPYFLSPIWGNASVDSVIRGKAWAPAGHIPPTARGAVMPEDVTLGVVARQTRLSHASVSLVRDGHLQFSKGTPDGICQILSVNGRQLSSLEIRGERSLQALSQRGLVVVRWKVGTSWQQASVLKP